MISRKLIIDSSIKDNKNKTTVVDYGFMISDHNRSFLLCTNRNSGKTTFLIKFLIEQILNNNNKKYLIISNSEQISFISTVLIKYLTLLNIDYIIKNKKYNEFTFINNCIINIDNKLNKYQNFDCILIDDAEYYFHHNENDYNSLLEYVSNTRLILTCSYNIGIASSSFKDHYYINFYNNIKKMGIKNFMVDDIMITRLYKINKIKNHY